MPVIMPYMTPRTYASLDLFATYWGAYTGARSAKHKMMLDLELKALDDDSLDDMIEDLHRRSRDLDKAITSLTQKDLLEQSKTERKTSKAAGADRIAVTRAIMAGEKSAESAKQSARRQRDAADWQLREVEEAENEESMLFLDRVAEAKGTGSDGYAGLAKSGADSAADSAAETSHYATQLSRLEEDLSGPYNKDRRDAYAYAMYTTAIEDHPDAAEYIKNNYDGFGAGWEPAETEARYLVDPVEQKKRRDETMRGYGVGYNLGFESAYEKAGEYADDSSSSTTTTTRTGGAEAGTVYGPELGRLQAERTNLGLQLAALYEAKLGSRAAGMNAIQQHMSMNFNFDPFAFAPDPDAQEFIDLMAEEGRRPVETMEAHEKHGTYRKMMEAQQEGEAGVFDPVRGTTTDEYASNDPGSYVMAHFYETLSSIEEMRPSQQYAHIRAAHGNLGRMRAMSGSDPSFIAHTEELFNKLEAMLNGSALSYVQQSAYREIEDDGGYLYRQYADGAVQVMEAPEQGQPLLGRLITDKNDPTWKEITKRAEEVDGPLSAEKLDQFATDQRGESGLPAPEMKADVSEAAALARSGMGASDVLFSQVMAEGLNADMAIGDPEKQRQGIHGTLSMAAALPESLVGDQPRMLAQRMELRAAEGDYPGLLGDIDRMIKAGAEPSRLRAEFEAYMLQYGNVIDRQRVPTGIGEGDRRTQEQWIDLERQAQRVKAEEEAAIDLQTRAWRQDVGYQDPTLPWLMQGGTGYRQDRQKLDDLEAEAKRLRDLIDEKSDTPGVSLTAEINALSKVTREIDLVRTREPQGSATPGLGPIEAKREKERQQDLAARNEALDILSKNYGWDVSELGVDPVDVLGRITAATTSGDTRPLLELEQHFSEKEGALRSLYDEQVAAGAGVDPKLLAAIDAVSIGAVSKVRELSRGISGARSVVAEDEDELILQEAAAAQQ